MQLPNYESFDSVPRLKIIEILEQSQEMMIQFEAEELDHVEKVVTEWAHLEAIQRDSDRGGEI